MGLGGVCGLGGVGVPVLACLCFMEWCLIRGHQATRRGKAGRR